MKTKKNLRKNKICSLLLTGFGALTIPIANDATAFAFILMISVPMFFSKENWIVF